ncbi:MAG: hypothetical protein H5U24_06090 [Thioclava marina]|nr:hypothetical protein [Thioclava marina]
MASRTPAFAGVARFSGARICRVFMTTGEAVLVDPLSDLVAHNVWVVRMVCDAFCVCQRGGFTEQAEEFVRFWRTREFGQDILEEPCFGPLFELLSGIRALLS